MKKVYEFALIVAGIDEEYQQGIIHGIIDYAKRHAVNISCFSAFGDIISGHNFNIGEYAIYSLINYEKFDGVIYMGNTIQSQRIKTQIQQDIEESGLPTITFDSPATPFFNINIDNSKPMEELVRHVILKHNARKLCFLSGPKNNPEAITRLEAFQKICKTYHIEDPQIYYGTFRAIDGKHAVKEILSRKTDIPDAIISANDAMALSAIKELKENGYNVPDDIIVTGFDNVFNAKHHSPALTTIDRPLEQAGKKACSILISQIEGRHPKQICTLNAHVVLTESCGCKNKEYENIADYKQTMYRIIDDNKFDARMIDELISKMSEANQMSDCMNAISEIANEIDCDRLCVCLCNDMTPYNENCAIEKQNYTNILNAPLVWTNGTKQYIKSVRKEDMTPVPFTSSGNITYYLPLHFRELCLGYIMITNSDFPTQSVMCHTLTMSISSSIENINKFISLNNAIDEINKLYTMDQLCNIYNRNGLQLLAGKIMKTCAERKIKMMISFIDMDGLKLINDGYGHKEGDFALKTIASVINKCCTDNLICARFGGDEFIAIGPDIGSKNFESKLRKELDNTNAMLEKPYKIDASVGSITANIEPNTDIFKLITQADSVMYEQKKRKKTSRYVRHE